MQIKIIDWKSEKYSGKHSHTTDPQSCLSTLQPSFYTKRNFHSIYPAKDLTPQSSGIPEELLQS